MKKNSIIIYILVGLLLGVGIWFFIAHRKTTPPPSGRTSNVSNFYDCFDTVGQFKPGKPQTCTYKEQTFTRPADFTNENVRDLSKVPESAKQPLLDLAKTNFDKCKNMADSLSVTKVYVVMNSSLVYFGTGCDSGYRQALVYQNGSWQTTEESQSGITCNDMSKFNLSKLELTKAGIAQPKHCT